MALRWTDSLEIALELMEAHPIVDVKYIRYTDLHRWITELEDFNDDPTKSNERILEAIQMAWLSELED